MSEFIGNILNPDNLSAQIDVPVADSVDNLHIEDVVGNKTDTVAGNSVIALEKQIIALDKVPAADSLANTDQRDVIGNKTDTIAGDSIMANTKKIMVLEMVPDADSVDNSYQKDVIGNKTDTVAGNSLVALLKQVINLDKTPAQNSAANVDQRDVIGNKTDNEVGNSLYSLSYILNKHFHSSSKVYPSLSNGLTVIGGAGVWELGAALTIVPANTIQNPFDIHYINVASASASDTYELVLYADSVEIGRVRVTRATGTQSVGLIPFMTPIIAANALIEAKVASQSGGGDSVTISIFYHEY